MSGVGEMATRLEASQSALMDALDGITEAELHSAPSEGEWTVAEICAHVIEMQPLWAGKAARIEGVSDLGRTPEEAEIGARQRSSCTRVTPPAQIRGAAGRRGRGGAGDPSGHGRRRPGRKRRFGVVHWRGSLREVHSRSHGRAQRRNRASARRARTLTGRLQSERPRRSRASL